MKKELKKLFSSKLMWIALALTILYMLFIPFNMLRTTEEAPLTTERESFDIIMRSMKERGISDDQIYDVLLNEYNKIHDGYDHIDEEYWYHEGKYGATLLEDQYMISKVMVATNYVNFFDERRRKTIEDLLYLSVSAEDEYKVKEYEKAIEQYNQVIPVSVSGTIFNQSEHYPYFNYTLWEYVMLAFIVMMTVRVFSFDRSSGAYRLINTCKKSKNRLFFRQLFAVEFIIAVIVTFHLIAEIYTDMAVLDLSDLSLPIQQYQSFEMCPFAISIGEFFLIKTLLKLAVYTFTVGFTAVFTTLFRKMLPSIVTALVFCDGGLLLNMAFYLKIGEGNGSLSAVSAQYNLIRSIIPQSLLNPREYLSKFDCANFLGNPSERMFICLGITIVLSAISICGSYFLYTRREG